MKYLGWFLIALTVFAYFDSIPIFIWKHIKLVYEKIRIHLPQSIRDLLNLFLKSLLTALIFIYSLKLYINLLMVSIAKKIYNPLGFLAVITLLFYVFWNLGSIIDNEFRVYYKNKFYTDILSEISFNNIVLAITESTVKILLILLPISLTFFYFSYKEFKSYAKSSSVFVNSSFVIYILSLILLILYGYVLSNKVSNTISILSDDSSSIFNISLLGNIIIFGFLLLLLLFSGFKTIKNHLSNLRIEKMLNTILSNIDDLFFDLRIIKPRRFRKKHYKNLTTSIETFYQLLTLSIDNKMYSSFETAINKWAKTLATITTASRLYLLDSTLVQEYLIFKDGEDYLDRYKDILKNHNTLIYHLIKSHRYEEAYRCIDIFINLHPTDKSSQVLEPIFLDAFIELTQISFNEEYILKKLLYELENLSLVTDDTDYIIICYIYKNLLINSINKNDTKSYSQIVYSILKAYQYIDHSNLNMNIRPSLISNVNSTELNSEIHKQHSIFQDCLIFILIQSAMKNIEISSYQNIGFLIKFIVTNFPGGVIKRIFKEYENSKGINNYLTDKMHGSVLSRQVSFNLNESTIEYCFNKFFILLYGQQVYIYQHNRKISPVRKKPYIEKINISTKQIKYLINNIVESQNKYGLQYLNNKKFISFLINKIKQ